MSRQWFAPKVNAEHRRPTLASRTLVYLKRPKITASFAIAVIGLDGLGGRLEGEDLDQVAQLFRMSGGSPLFDLEHGERVFHRCRMGGDVAGESIYFWFESMSSVKSDPYASRR